LRKDNVVNSSRLVYDELSEISDVSMERPHVVILGAGASKAAFPEGDKNGKRLPLMKDLVEVVGLTPLLKKAGIGAYNNNFEELYSRIYADEKLQGLLKEIENKIYNYFSSLELPDDPTLYDHLVLSLREKDLIATFNWDPFLFKALDRNHQVAESPKAVFLHGSVGIGYCMRHKGSQVGAFPGRCSVCDHNFEKSPLLFPIEKHYANNSFIKTAWDILQGYIKDAFILTIFGYSAPETDVEAMSLMRNAWDDSYRRDTLELVEIIDTKDKRKLRNTWKDFTAERVYYIHKTFYQSYIALHPRRSCEALGQQWFGPKFTRRRRIPRRAKFAKLWHWFRPLVEAEKG
jgi:hypothetical protein